LHRLRSSISQTNFIVLALIVLCPLLGVVCFGTILMVEMTIPRRDVRPKIEQISCLKSMEGEILINFLFLPYNFPI
jgi:hypothetical protein